MITEYHLEVKNLGVPSHVYKTWWAEFTSNTYSLPSARREKSRLEDHGYQVRIVKYTQAAPKRIGVVK